VENIENREDEYLSNDALETHGRPAESMPAITKTERVDSKPMDIDEAAMQMRLSKRNFLVFTNSKSKNTNVIYRRKDGNLGLIEAFPK
jgi:putative sigma-54 modulation protein